MDLLKNVKNVFLKAGVQAKQTVDFVKVEKRIKEYQKERDQICAKIGQMIYEDKQNQQYVDEEVLSQYIISIKSIDNRINQWKGKLSSIKTNKKEQPIEPQVQHELTLDVQKPTKGFKYVKLDKKAEDLKVTRTDKGIAILRFCSVCGTGNPSAAVCCLQCGKEFSLQENLFS